MLSKDRNQWSSSQIRSHMDRVREMIADLEVELKQLDDLHFKAHCREAEEIVDSWPEWKRQACGLRPLVHGDC